ncbi:unnamed protein product [Danaus chrysippus]|uniref:(African queen) hypothetical protein n=1 Tax=Danaus chrysippus TaxID=151541 RepID=A0A8J2RDA7_9NEOP|nr:unnamed protein product [Danaus chrysippus]
MVDLMWNYIQRTKERIDAATYIRIRYEETPHFELGYVVGEVLERYKKMVWNIKRPMIFKSDAVFDIMKRLEMVQNIFLDILHLTYMINEISKKYAYLSQSTGPGAGNYTEDFEDMENKRKLLLWMQKKRQKEMKKIRNMIFKGEVQFTQSTRKKPKKMWPLDYGWEIDYKWW